MRGDDDLGHLRLEHRDRVAHSVRRLCLDDEAVSRHSGFTQSLERPVEPPAGGRAARVVVDNVPLVRMAHRGEDGDQLGRPTLDRLDQARPGDSFVRDHEEMTHGALASSSSRSRAPLNTACRAPGTPYSYGPPTTCGISSKLKIGGGEETCHSRVIARHGFPGARGPRSQLTIML